MGARQVEPGRGIAAQPPLDIVTTLWSYNME